MLCLGLISGTSVDGIDAALLECGPRPRLLAARTTPLELRLREQVLRWSQQHGAVDLDAFGQLDRELGEAFADAALGLLAASGIPARQLRVIGSHGQTLRHRPQPPHRFTLQLGDPHVIAERTGIDVVADFRRRDLAAGGQGAPLLPAFHAAWFGSPDEPRAVLNLGGIGNLTLLDPGQPVRGFDTGPANALLDAWCQHHTGERFDAEGAWAAGGRPDQGLLERLLAEPWFALPGPKSSGREHFQLDWLASRLIPGLAARDVQASLVELTVRSIADALRRAQPGCRRLLVCGGGVHNVHLLRRLREGLPGMMLESTAEHGIDPDVVEAAGFAWLAGETIQGRPGNRPEVTGAAGLRVLGAIHPGRDPRAGD